jgi:hypothetical protein
MRENHRRGGRESHRVEVMKPLRIVHSAFLDQHHRLGLKVPHRAALGKVTAAVSTARRRATSPITTLRDSHLNSWSSAASFRTRPERIDGRVVAKNMRALTFDAKGKASFAFLNDAKNIRNIFQEFRVRPIRFPCCAVLDFQSSGLTRFHWSWR